MTEQLREKAEARFEEALARSGARDPRDFYRDRLRALRGRNRAAYDRAVEYFDTRLLPAVADDASDPLTAWLEYGRFLAELAAPGRTVQVDETGRARDYAPPARPADLVLHLPAASRDEVLVVGLPAQLSAAQRATYRLLVGGKQE